MENSFRLKEKQLIITHILWVEAKIKDDNCQPERIKGSFNLAIMSIDLQELFTNLKR